ncbi:MAG: N-formylglutamate amidohydrolase [Acidobacteriota bacterium]
MKGKYYFPFHRRLEETIEKDKNDLLLCVDCHSMAETGPSISPDRGKPRPLFCLGNRFGASSSDEVARRMKACLMDAFELGDEDVTINKPFAGGYITRHYGNKPVPWIQVEMNRILYLSKPWFDPETLELSRDRIDELNQKFYLALKTFFQ